MIKLNKDLFRMNFEKVNIQELYCHCSTDFERDIVLIIKKATMYKGMKLNKKYTLKELGL